jgi:signal transduction histidine kinase
MPIESLRTALTAASTDDSIIREFLQVWPLVESILEAFSKATKLPIFAYLAGQMIFQSSAETMPPFCCLMLGSPDTSAKCKSDAFRRASKDEPFVGDRIQYCHAGMVNGRREIETGLNGMLTILFGAKRSVDPEALRRRETIIQAAAVNHPDQSIRLRDADTQDHRASVIEPSESTLMDAIAEIIQSLLSTTVSARALAINMAHELSLVMLGMGLLATEIEDLASEFSKPEQMAQNIVGITAAHRYLLAECRLGLYVVRNFLSHTSETRYRDVVLPQFNLVRIGVILSDMIELYKVQAAKKQIVFDVSGLEELPSIYGSEMELQRLLHNLLNNAVKYSYHSVAGSQRTIRIRTRVPYDPGFRRRRFAIVIENYGLGLAKDERGFAFRPGFRGRQAAKEVPIGAGIGLSEASKIMKIHNGQMRMRSEELHLASVGGSTFLTTIELIFPYSDRLNVTGVHHR